MGNEKVLKVFHAARQDIEIVMDNKRGSFRNDFVPPPPQGRRLVPVTGISIAYDQRVQTHHRPRPDKNHRFPNGRGGASEKQMPLAATTSPHLREVSRRC